MLKALSQVLAASETFLLRPGTVLTAADGTSNKLWRCVWRMGVNPSRTKVSATSLRGIKADNVFSAVKGFGQRRDPRVFYREWLAAWACVRKKSADADIQQWDGRLNVVGVVARQLVETASAIARQCLPSAPRELESHPTVVGVDQILRNFWPLLIESHPTVVGVIRF